MQKGTAEGHECKAFYESEINDDSRRSKQVCYSPDPILV